MPKLWTQYDAATQSWIPWEANTLPSADSIFRARFLSQFVAWIKYLSAMENGHSYVDFVYPAKGDYRGTIIQTAAFWQGLNWTPSPDWLAIQEADVYAGATIADATVKLIDSDDYAATEFTDIEKGDVIHPMNAPTCRMRNMLWKLRRRIDLCHVLNKGFQTIASTGRHYYYEGIGPFPFQITGASYPTYGARRYNSTNNLALDNACIAAYLRNYIVYAGGVGEARLSCYPVGMYAGTYNEVPADGMTATLSYFSDNGATWHYFPGWSYNYVDLVGMNASPPTRKIIDANMIATGERFYSSYTFPSITFAYAESFDASYHYFDAWYHPLSTPHSNYMPDESMFND